jgi:hypothetical protein
MPDLSGLYRRIAASRLLLFSLSECDLLVFTVCFFKFNLCRYVAGRQKQKDAHFTGYAVESKKSYHGDHTFESLFGGAGQVDFSLPTA